MGEGAAPPGVEARIGLAVRRSLAGVVERSAAVHEAVVEHKALVAVAAVAAGVGF